MCIRDSDMLYLHMTRSDKPHLGAITEKSRAEDSVAMARLLHGDAVFDNNCVIMGNVNTNSPLHVDKVVTEAIQVYCGAGQGIVVVPFILGGAMGPVTTAAAVSQALAEAMVCCAFSQLVRPGAPVVFGSFASSMSMQSGAPTFGTPEPANVLYVMAALARRLGVPFRSGGHLCTSKLADAQAAYESAATMQPTVLGGVNFVLHSAGWLEGGLVMGYEKFVLDNDQCGMVETFLKGVDLSENGQAMDAIRDTGPGQHFLGCAHTQANFETAFYRSTIADNNSFEQWQAEGSLDAEQRANGIWKRMLEAYQAPEMDPGRDEALTAFIEAKKAAVPDANY